MKRILQLILVAIITSCGSPSIKDTNFSNINDPCDFLEEAEILIDRFIEIHEEYGKFDEEDLPIEIRTEVEIIKLKNEEMEECVERNNWREEDVETCSRFNEIRKKAEMIDFF